MSELPRLSFDTLGGSSGFRTDARFTTASEHAYPMPNPVPEDEPEDPLAVAFAEGYAAGAAQAHAEAERQTEAEAAARELLALSFERLDRDLAEELRLRLRDTVAALCETAIAPLALDDDALVRRVERAVSMLSRADDERLIRLHPDDLALVAPRLSADWQVLADATLERGAVRVESTQGGVEDGPEQWRRAIAEALRQC